jgi:hypothetical protein
VIASAELEASAPSLVAVARPVSVVPPASRPAVVPPASGFAPGVVSFAWPLQPRTTARAIEIGRRVMRRT